MDSSSIRGGHLHFAPQVLKNLDAQDHTSNHVTDFNLARRTCLGYSHGPCAMEKRTDHLPLVQ